MAILPGTSARRLPTRHRCRCASTASTRSRETPGRWVSPALGALLAAYAGHAGATASLPDFAQRVTGCWFGRTVHLALECASAVGDATHPAVQDMLAAAAAARAPSRRRRERGSQGARHGWLSAPGGRIPARLRDRCAGSRMPAGRPAGRRLDGARRPRRAGRRRAGRRALRTLVHAARDAATAGHRRSSAAPRFPAQRVAGRPRGRVSETAGWTVTATDPRGTLSAVNGDAARLLRPGDYVMRQRPGVPPAPGERVEPVARLDHLDIERGIWWTFTEPGPEPPIGRLYFDARPATAPRAVHEITAALANLTFQMKCPISVAACARVDAIVLYHPRAARDELIAALFQHWTTLGALLDPAVPPLTCAVRPGVGWADDTPERPLLRREPLPPVRRCDRRSRRIVGCDGRRRAAADSWSNALRTAGSDPQCPWVSAR